MSSSSTRWSVARSLAICVQFLPWPKSPWQKATTGPRSPSRVACSAGCAEALTAPVCQHRAMTRRTPPTAQQWYDDTRSRISATGYRPAPWTDWPTWPFEGELVQRDLEPPVAERTRGGDNGVDCFICEAAADPGSDYVV